MNEFPKDLESEQALEENYQARISALLDGELPTDQLIPTLDYLVATDEARAFYRRARALEGLLTVAEQSPAREVARRERRPDVKWSAIEDRLQSAPGDSRSGNNPEASRSMITSISERRNADQQNTSSSMMRMLVAAAAGVLIMMIGLSSWRVWQNGTPSQPPAEFAQLDSVTVGGRAGEMTDGRFLDLAREILESDRRYRLEMLELMNAVDEQPLIERSTKESRPVTERGGESTPDYDDSDFDTRSEHLSNRPQVKLW